MRYLSVVHFHVLIWNDRKLCREGAICANRPGAEREAEIERTTPAGKPNGKRVTVKPCENPCLGGKAG